MTTAEEEEEEEDEEDDDDDEDDEEEEEEEVEVRGFASFGPSRQSTHPQRSAFMSLAPPIKGTQ